MSASLDGLLSSSEARRSVFIFSLSILWYLRKVTVAFVWDMGVERFQVKLIEKWSEKASVVWTLEILSLLYCLCMGDLQAPPAPHFVFLITL